MIQIQSLNKYYDRHKVLSDISINIPSGQVFALLGPNGSGKSTLLKCLVRLSFKSSGTIFINETDISEKSYLPEIGYMPQLASFPKNQKVKDIISFFEKIEHTESYLKEKLISDLGINKFTHKNFGDLSGGMKQKVNILQCFMFRKKLYVLDEPTASLDPVAVFYLKALIKDKKKEGSSVLFTTHIIQEVEEIADTLCMIFEGKVILKNTPTEIMKQTNTSSLEEALLEYWKGGVKIDEA